MAIPFDEQLIPLREAFKPLLGGDRKYEKNLYYRHPETWSTGTAQEKPNARANWIIWAGNNRDRMADMMERGFTPLRKFGIAARYAQDEPQSQGTPDQYGPWGAILMHPEGPAAFPISQIMTYRWYDPRHCPVPGVVFPQLDGVEIAEYACPDCNDRVFSMALHLSRHLRAQHDWSVDDVVKFGAAMGLDFSREFTKGVKNVRTYSAGQDERPATRGEAPRNVAPVVVERIVPTRSAPEEKPARTPEEQAKIDTRMAAMRAAREAKKAA